MFSGHPPILINDLASRQRRYLPDKPFIDHVQRKSACPSPVKRCSSVILAILNDPQRNQLCSLPDILH
jgi:hypothetical protein